jgi:hypothetical protein
MKDLSFKLKTKAWPVTMENAQGQEIKYELRELKAADRDKYVDKLQGRLKVDKQGNVIGLTQYAGMQADLITICMYDEENKPVDRATLNTWPGTTVTKLFHAAQTLNGFREVEERHKVYAEELVKFLKEKAVIEDGQLDPTDVEEFLDETEKHLFGEAEDRQDAEAEAAAA